jgi:hypothetical protein
MQYKNTSLYLDGMKVLMSRDNLEWKRVGIAINYQKVQIGEEKSTFMMEFIHEIEPPLQTYYFAYGYPYTYTCLDKFISKLTT